MLQDLHISDLGVIDDLDLPLHPGLNVLTGETGTGKTMVTIGLALALGARASATLVRHGARAARVQAGFEVTGEGAAAEVDEWADDGDLILARTVPASGKATARISGQLATASALADLGEHLVEIHGQDQTQRLLTAATQTAFLDRFAGDEHLVALAGYREAYERLRELRHRLGSLREASRDRERELDLLAYQVREIEAVDPQPDESSALSAEEARLGHVERLLDLSASVERMLDGDDAATSTPVAAAARTLAEVADLDPSACDLAERAAALTAEMAELTRDARTYREALSSDPERLQAIRLRIEALRSLQRKYGETDDDVRAFLARASGRLADLDGADERLEALSEQAVLAEAETKRRADVVSAGRVRASEMLAEAISVELQDLGMPGAVVRVELEPLDPPGPMGGERAELRFAADRGRPPLPLSAAASGGELSRIMLACRSVLVDIDRVATVVFDEVDAGIGGQAGLAVGRRLAILGRDRQVIVVTHLPQIACFADRHIRITKDAGTARIQVLDHDDRLAELSRMLAGLADSAGALTHAEELLDEAATHASAIRSGERASTTS